MLYFPIPLFAVGIDHIPGLHLTNKRRLCFFYHFQVILCIFFSQKIVKLCQYITEKQTFQQITNMCFLKQTFITFLLLKTKSTYKQARKNMCKAKRLSTPPPPSNSILLSPQPQLSTQTKLSHKI